MDSGEKIIESDIELTLEQKYEHLERLISNLPPNVQSLLLMIDKPFRCVTRSNVSYYGMLSSFDFELKSLTLANEQLIYSQLDGLKHREVTVSSFPVGSLSYYEEIITSRIEPEKEPIYQTNYETDLNLLEEIIDNG